MERTKTRINRSKIGWQCAHFQNEIFVFVFRCELLYGRWRQEKLRGRRGAQWAERVGDCRLRFAARRLCARFYCQTDCCLRKTENGSLGMGRVDGIFINSVLKMRVKCVSNE